MDEVERLLRLLALNDEQSLDRLLGSRADAELAPGLDPKVDLLIRLGALLAVGASTSSLRATVERAIAVGASPAEVTDVLVAVAPAVGAARVVSGASRLAAALGYEIDRDD